MYTEEGNLTTSLEQLKKGDESAFAVLYNQTYKYVYSRAKCMLSNEDEVQDLIQEVYLALHKNAASIKSDASIFAWLKTTTFYQGTKMLQKKRKEVLLTEEGEGMFETIPDEEVQIEEDFADKEDIEVIRACIDRLSDEQKTVLLAYYYDNLKVNEIAEMLSLSEGTVKSRLHLARKNLKTHIEGEEAKRGYKLHSFGGVTLALAIRALLQTNAEAAEAAEATIFSNVCQNLNFRAAHTTGAKTTAAKTIAAKNGLLTRVAGLGAKKLAIVVTSLVTITGAVGVATIEFGNDDSKETTKISEEKERVEGKESPQETTPNQTENLDINNDDIGNEQQGEGNANENVEQGESSPNTPNSSEEEEPEEPTGGTTTTEEETPTTEDTTIDPNSPSGEQEEPDNSTPDTNQPGTYDPMESLPDHESGNDDKWEDGLEGNGHETDGAWPE